MKKTEEEENTTWGSKQIRRYSILKTPSCFKTIWRYTKANQKPTMHQSWSAFDVIGPVMIGPSSSHTAGAAKIGYFARIINGQQPQKIKLMLHGSFGKVYKGHQTDKAIIGGILGYLPHSGEIANAEKLAKKNNLKVEISSANLGDTIHPNSVRIIMKNKDGSQHQVRAKSIGGGKIVIREIDKIDCRLDMSYSSLIVIFDNTAISALKIIDHVKSKEVHIINFETHHYKDRTMLDVEIKEKYNSSIIHDLETLPGIELARYLNHLTNYDKYAS